jgi:hypothetical protein
MPQQSIEAGTVVLTVPAAVALSVEELPGVVPTMATSIKCQDWSVFRKLPWYAQFDLYLYKLDKLSSTKQNTDFRPWLDSLPRQFSTPIHWKANQRDELLQYAHMVEAVDRQESFWRSTFDRLRK